MSDDCLLLFKRSTEKVRKSTVFLFIFPLIDFYNTFFPSFFFFSNLPIREEGNHTISTVINLSYINVTFDRQIIKKEYQLNRYNERNNKNKSGSEKY